MERRGFLGLFASLPCIIPFLGKKVAEFHTMGQHFGKTAPLVHKDDINNVLFSRDGVYIIRGYHNDGFEIIVTEEFGAENFGLSIPLSERDFEKIIELKSKEYFDDHF